MTDEPAETNPLTESDEHDIGDGVGISWIVDAATDVVLGLIERHDCAFGRAGGQVPVVSAFQPDADHWTVEAGDLGTVAGLTLTPSIRCAMCGHHGFIVDGRWQPAA